MNTSNVTSSKPRLLAMAMFQYFKRTSLQDNAGFPSVVSSKDVQHVNDSVKLSMEREASEIKRVKLETSKFWKCDGLAHSCRSQMPPSQPRGNS